MKDYIMSKNMQLEQKVYISYKNDNGFIEIRKNVHEQ